MAIRRVGAADLAPAGTRQMLEALGTCGDLLLASPQANQYGLAVDA
jgi:hypothetical protein